MAKAGLFDISLDKQSLLLRLLILALICVIGSPIASTLVTYRVPLTFFFDFQPFRHVCFPF
jgi:hypothetical protein